MSSLLFTEDYHAKKVLPVLYSLTPGPAKGQFQHSMPGYCLFYSFYKLTKVKVLVVFMCKLRLAYSGCVPAAPMEPYSTTGVSENDNSQLKV